VLQIPARPSGNVQLPYTTADMAERLAKRKAEKDRQDILDSLKGGLSYGKSGVDITPQLSQVGGMVKGLIQMPAATVMDVVSGIVRPLDKYVGGVKDPVDQFRPEDYGTSNLITGTAQGLEQAGRRAVGDITAIPRVGKPSASPTATDIKRLGVIEGLSKAGIDYGNLALTAAPFVKPSAFGISNAYKDMLEARLARQNRSPFPTVKTPGAFIDVDALQGSRLPARIVDTPATPATRLAEAQTQRALPPAAQRALTPAQVAPIEVAPRAPLPWVRNALPNSRIVKYTAPVLDKYGTRILDGKDITLRSLTDKKSYEMMDGVMQIVVDYKTQTATLEMMGVANEFVTPQLAAAAFAELSAFDFLKTKYPLIPSRNIPRPLIEQLQQAGLIDPNYEIPPPGPQNMNDIVQRPLTLASDRPFDYEVIPQNYQSYYDSIIDSMFPQKVFEPNYVIDSDAAAHYFLDNGGALDQVPPQYLWHAIESNGFTGGRFDQIGSAGGHIGMDRYVDKATGKYIGLKYHPGKKTFALIPSELEGPMAEILSNDIAVDLGFLDMNLRPIHHSDGSVSIITDLAQDVYGGDILDSHMAESIGKVDPFDINNRSAAPANFVPIEDRIRLAVLDELTGNVDRNTGNILFSVDQTGKVRLVPIDHEITLGGVGQNRLKEKVAMNWSIRNAYNRDKLQLFEEIKTIIAKIQQELKPKAQQMLQNFEAKLLETAAVAKIDTTKWFRDPANPNSNWAAFDFEKKIKYFEDNLNTFLSDTPDAITQKYINEIKKGNP